MPERRSSYPPTLAAVVRVSSLSRAAAAGPPAEKGRLSMTVDDAVGEAIRAAECLRAFVTMWPAEHPWDNVTADVAERANRFLEATQQADAALKQAGRSLAAAA